ncbi:Lipase [Macleaya cordata]|uniref:Lipase n=1 Tax=Macleaya cordata TaxID=56857 RepID=A0A200QPG2_MACCD|nr:Lipase [Macleaya cordata]
MLKRLFGGYGQITFNFANLFGGADPSQQLYFQKSSSTQAFICCDAPKDAKLIIVAFRGTEPFNAQDWSTDVDLSWFSMGKMGRVHLGFMKALGLQDDKDYVKGWPKNYTGDKKLAYYTIREKLRTLLDQNKGARIIVTGHSLGGALAALFPSLLILHQEDTILNSLFGVYTFGQPRVGDKDFGSIMKANLNVTFKRYHRVVYRFDLVPRVPFDDPISQFVHYGGCLYFSSWYKGEVMKKEPNQNYFNPLYLIPKYFNAWLDLFRGIFAGIKLGKDFQESLVSILFRMVGLFVPGLASHSPRDTVNSARLAKITITQDYEEELEFV